MTNIWADPSVCERGESALECEIRVNNPSIMFVNLGSNWIPGVGMDVYYTYLSDIVRTLLDHGILPILSSKADNVEGDNSINETTAQVARDFDIPFYNFWAISQYLPNQGLDPTRDGIHLSIEAWNWRNYYALQTLEKPDGANEGGCGIHVSVDDISKLGLLPNDFIVLIVGVLLILFVSILQERNPSTDIRTMLDQKPFALRFVLLYLGVMAVLVFGIYGSGYNAADFVYMQF